MKHCPECGVYLHGPDLQHAEGCPRWAEQFVNPIGEKADGPASVRESIADADFRDRTIVRAKPKTIYDNGFLAADYPGGPMKVRSIAEAKRREQVPPTRRVMLRDPDEPDKNPDGMFLDVFLSVAITELEDQLKFGVSFGRNVSLRRQVIEALTVAQALELYRCNVTTPKGTPA